MNTQNFIDKAYVLQCIDKIEDLFQCGDEYTSREIAKLTATLSREEQQLLMDEWIVLSTFGCEAELLTPKHIIDDLYLDKLKGE